jgi:hypothetical protein
LDVGGSWKAVARSTIGFAWNLEHSGCEAVERYYRDCPPLSVVPGCGRIA